MAGNQYEIIAWDLDGTLSHSLPDIAASLNMTLSEEGYPLLDEARIQSYLGDGVSALVERALSCSLSGNADFCLEKTMLKRVTDRYRDIYAANCTKRSRLYDGIPQILQQLSHKKQAIITNKPMLMTGRMLEHYQIVSFFGIVIAGDSLPQRKPHPEPVQLALRHFQKKAENMILIGDSTVDIATARNAGIAIAAVTWGYTDLETLAEAQPDFIIHKPEELLSIFN
ncbi:MAG TPA: HAD family hydrolase [Candidatus Marinimicrobia bacterium]|nr:HAD family hydrolase [Candidatus Neomarinimicrobiota bacterium]